MISSGVECACAARTRSTSAASAGSEAMASFAPMGRLEAREVGEGQQTAPHVHLAALGAAHEGRDHLARIEQLGGIEGALARQHLFALLGRELHAHRAELLDADAVL